MYLLYLNPMRDRTEARRLVARAETREALMAFVEREIAEPYIDAGERRITHETDMIAQMAGGLVDEHIPGWRWQKTFRKGGPLEWFNPPLGDDCVVEVSLEQDIAKLTETWDRMLAETPLV